MNAVKKHATKYDIITKLSNAPSGLSIEQLLRGDTGEARKNLRRLLVSFTPTRKVNCTDLQGKLEWILMLYLVQVYGSGFLALLEHGGALNLTAMKLLKILEVELKPARRMITVVGGEHVNCVGVICDVPICFRNVSTAKNFPAVNIVPVDV